MWLLSYVIGTVLPINITSYNPLNVTEIWIFVFSVLGAILFCIWIYYLTIYNNEDHFGKYNKWDDLKFLLVFMIGVKLLMSFSYPMQLQVKTRLANTFTDAALAQQYNVLNLGNKYLTSSIEDFQYCGYEIHDVVSNAQLQKDTTADGEGRYYHDLAKYNNFTRFSYDNTDYVKYNFSSLFFPTKSKQPSAEFNQTFYTDIQIEKEYGLHRTEASKLNAIKNYFEVLKKYQNENHRNTYTPQDYLDNYNHIEKTCTSFFPEAYNLSPDDKTSDVTQLPVNDISYNIETIFKAKFSLPYILSDGYLLFAFYFSFFVSLFIILFRNNKWQHYLVSVVSFILIGIILGILSAIFTTLTFSSLFPTLCILTWMAAGIISLKYYFIKDKYSIVGVVATNLFYICLPVMPFLISVYCHETFGLLKCDYSTSTELYFAEQCQLIDSQYSNLLMYTQLIGISAFVIIGMPFYKLFYIKQKALPREK
jgi:ABC-type Fe3+-siderophore transport system permease subunit